MAQNVQDQVLINGGQHEPPTGAFPHVAFRAAGFSPRGVSKLNGVSQAERPEDKYVPARARTTERASRQWERCGRRAFTLIEMVVVVAVALVLLGIVLPAATALWSQRRVADAANTIQGVLSVARSRAMRTGGRQAGLFFYVDAEGVQRIAQIEQIEDKPIDDNPSNPLNLARGKAFRFTEDADQVLPVPMRVVPRYAADLPPVPNDPTTDWKFFSVVELAREDPITAPLPAGVNEPQRNRNFFTMIYAPDGRLLPQRDVVIQDSDTERVYSTYDGDGFGDRTGFRVGNGSPGDRPEVKFYFPKDASVKEPLDPRPGVLGPVDHLITVEAAGDPMAINFPSVDGLLLYDDSLFRGVADNALKRDFLLRTAQPYYISRNTGAVIRGPVGEAAR